MSTDTPQKLQDELTAMLAPDFSAASVAMVQAWLATMTKGGFTARCVVTANIATLGGAGSFAGVAGGSTTNSDGVTCVAGDVVLLYTQTTAAQNGLYLVGTVAAGTAPLTRIPMFPTGAALPGGFQVNVGGEGTVYKNTRWKSFSAAQFAVVDTTDPKFFPETVSWTSALVGGVITCGLGATTGAPSTAPIFSAKSYITGVKSVSGGTIAVNGYAQLVPATPGVSGVGTATLTACIAAGTIQAGDTSTMFCTLTNQG